MVLGASAPLVTPFHPAHPSVNSPFINFFSKKLEVPSVSCGALADTVTKPSHLGEKELVEPVHSFGSKPRRLTTGAEPLGEHPRQGN